MDELAKQTLQAARDKEWQIATAESCTGGLIAASLTEITGSSDVFDRGFVTYSNAAKQKMLGVRTTTLEAFGAVSEETAIEMAQGALDNSIADIAVSVTGIAGPGGSDHKPEGRVCFGLAIKNTTTFSQTVEFGAIGRKYVRIKTVQHALNMIFNAANAAR